MNVFDLDGVITNPENSNVNSSLVEQMYFHLKAGYKIAVNTGRSYDWVEKNLVNYLKSQGDDTIFERLIIVCEKGGEMVTITPTDTRIMPSRFALDKQDYDITKSVTDALMPKLTTMFWDDTKRTMATIEKLPKADLATFHLEQKILTSALTSKLHNDSIRIDATTIATDVESIEAGKYAGAELIFEWAKQNFPEIDSFVCYGDSISDYDMARCFASYSANVTFVYVGKKSDEIKVAENIRLVVTAQKFDQGTLEYLTNN